MSRFRLFLLWLVMAALPLQGWAAASMLLCGGSLQAAGTHAAAQPAMPAGHDHAAHGHGAHDTGGRATQLADASAGDAAQPATDSSHTCGICASCCHSVALAESIRPTRISPAPRADLAEPVVLIQARPSTAPERPPRA